MEIPFLGNRYEVKQRLSKKPGRQTYLVFDRQTQDFVIIKLLIFGYDFDWDHLKLFEREANILKTLSHSAIPRYRDSFELDLPDLRGFALVQNYIDAKSLESHLQVHRTFSEAEIKQIAEDVLDVLIYLHRRNPPIIHRDIKPSNILLTNRSGHSAGQVYVVDFGSVQNSVSLKDFTWSIAGTYGYTPLEQFGGRAVPASDLYGLGTTLIHLITGQHPADFPEQDLRIQFDQTLDNISPSLKQWLRKMTEPSLKRRFSSSQEALQALKNPQPEGALSVSNQPVNSQISLTKSAEELRILIPPLSVRQRQKRPKLLERVRRSSLIPRFARELPSPLLIIFLGIVTPYYAFLFALILAFWSVLPILGPLFWAGILLVLLLLPYVYMMQTSKVNLRLVRGKNIEQDRIYFYRDFLGIKLSRSSSFVHRGTVRLQQLNLKIKEAGEEDGISCKSGLSELIIWIDNQKYSLDELTPSELNWLSQELSDWLDVTIECLEIPVVQKFIDKKKDSESGIS